MTPDDNLRVRIAIVKLTGMVIHLIAEAGTNPEWDAVLADAVDSNLEALRLLDPEGTDRLDRKGLLRYASDLWGAYVRNKRVSRKGFEDRAVIPTTGPQRGEA